MSGQGRRIFNKRSMDGDAENPDISRAAVRSAMQGFLSSPERKRRVPVSDDELDASTTCPLCNSTRTVGSARQPKELARGAATGKEASPPHDAVLWQQFRATTMLSVSRIQRQTNTGRQYLLHVGVASSFIPLAFLGAGHGACAMHVSTRYLSFLPVIEHL